MGRPLAVRTSEALHTGHIISGIGHLGVIGWALLGGVFQPAPPPLEVTEVAVISADVFDRMTSAPSAVTDVALPLAPSEAVELPTAREPDPVVQPAVPEASDAPEAEVIPERPQPQPIPEIVEDTPAPPAPEPSEAVDAPQISDRPVQRPSERIAPEAVEAPEPDVTPDPVDQAAVTPDEAPSETPVEEQKETAQEEAAEEIVPETEPPSKALKVSKRPPARRPAPPKPVEAAEQAPSQTDDSAVQAALEAAQAASDTQPDVPVGPPLTGGEEQGFLRQVERCWNITAMSTEAQRTIVTVAFSLNQDGTPVSGSLRMIAQSGGSEAAARKAYEVARRAILRCGSKGYDMPQEKYAHWKDIELTFNPEKMRLR